MKANEAERLASNLITKFGLPVKAIVISTPEGQNILITPEDIHHNDGYKVAIRIGWRSLYMQLIFGKFAADLVKQMGKSSSENKKKFSSVSQLIIKERGILIFKVNDKLADPLDPQTWPENWNIVELSLKKSPLEVNTDDHALTEHLINTWVERFFGCIIALSPLEKVEENNEVFGIPEGALKKELVNRYERSRYNRTICINYHGCRCAVCNFDFEQKYGNIGIGFIHVHHIVPISQLGTDYLIDPVNDLIPVCPNCHSMLHKKNPPFTIDELKLTIDQKGD